jgi:hypothetical protein
MSSWTACSPKRRQAGSRQKHSGWRKRVRHSAPLVVVRETELAHVTAVVDVEAVDPGMAVQAAGTCQRQQLLDGLVVCSFLASRLG